MSDSTVSTVPMTPSSSLHHLPNQSIDDVFAWLKPINPVACEAFDDVVNAVNESSTTYTHTRHFLQATQDRSTRADSVFTDNTDDGDDGRPSQDKPRWSGSFKLSLKTLPFISGEGWSLGTGRGLPEGEKVDVMLAPPSKRWIKRIAGKHARLLFHKESGRLTLEARHRIKLSGMDGADMITSNAIRALDTGHFISIGDCLYTFEYTDLMKSEGFLNELSRFMRAHHGTAWVLPRTLSSALAGDHISLGDYTCTPGAFAKGTFGEVGAGWARDGSTVAIKRFKTPKEESLKTHQEMMRYLGHHDNILTFLGSFSNFDLTYPGAFCVYKPLAMGSLLDVMNLYSSDIFSQCALLVDYLKGLTYLHDQKGVTHRDVNPKNLGVVSFNPPRGVLLDLDSATREEESTDHMQGTVPYFAPEIMKLKEQSRSSSRRAPGPIPYSKYVDIWALGLSLFALYTGFDFNWGPYNPRRVDLRTDELRNFVELESHIMFRDHLQAKQVSAGGGQAKLLLGLVQLMTKWDPEDRIEANQALGTAQDIVSNQQLGSIEPKAAPKRGLSEV